jgi:hypothetical protein
VFSLQPQSKNYKSGWLGPILHMISVHARLRPLLPYQCHSQLDSRHSTIPLGNCPDKLLENLKRMKAAEQVGPWSSRIPGAQTAFICVEGLCAGVLSGAIPWCAS